MTGRIMVGNLAIADPEERPAADEGGQTSAIVVELDSIIGKSRRRSVLRRVRRSIGETLARWLDGLVPPAGMARNSGLPPQIRFPFF